MICTDLGFILRSISERIMGCFFGCFRVKDDGDRRRNHHIVSDVVSSKNGDLLVSRNRLASLLLSEGLNLDDLDFSNNEAEVTIDKRKVHRFSISISLYCKNKDGSPCKDKMHFSSEVPCHDSTNEDLKDEAKFLKSCGALLETPAEIRKTYGGKDLAPHDEDSETSKFHSWLPSTSIKKLQWEEQLHQVPANPVKIGEEAGSPEHISSSCRSQEQKLAGRNSIGLSESSGIESPDSSIKVPVHSIDNDTSPINPELPAVTTQSKNKFVHFECASNMVYHPSSGQSSNLFDFTDSGDRSKQSPYPTPLKLTDEMQTPGTVYATNPDNLSNARNRIRSQYVYPVLNPVQDFSQWKAMKEEDSDPHQQLDHLRESCEQSENTCPGRTSVSGASNSLMVFKTDTEVAEEAKVDASLTQWLKQSSSAKGENGPNHGELSGGRSQSSKTPDTDRPILGTVAAHWNDDEPSRISPKWWDGNGIPNSTNKYKEDQKVSWHATPFEERLEKALSDESLVYQRKIPEGRPIDFDEIDEDDTAISRLQPSAHPESVVSF